MDYKKLINGFKSKEKRIENLVFLLIILIITLIIINSILKSDEDKNETIDSNNMSFSKSGVSSGNESSLIDVENLSYSNIQFEEKLEEILSEIKGIEDTKVLITYSETEEIIPIYNENNSISETEEGTGENKKIVKEESISKDIILDDSSNILIQKKKSPKVEGAIIVVKGNFDVNVETNIVSAVEAITGLASHKIQVFEMGEN